MAQITDKNYNKQYNTIILMGISLIQAIIILWVAFLKAQGFNKAYDHEFILMEEFC